MAGFFGLFDYNKEGKGVSKDEPPKSPFIIFFEILGRKFWNFVKLNFMFLIFNLPAMIIATIIMVLFAPSILGVDNYNNIIQAQGDILLGFSFPIAVLFVCIPVITTGPTQAGLTYIYRNYAREEHAFMWSDFKEHAISNFKQSSIVSIINTIAFFMLSTGLMFYFKNSATSTNILWSIATGLTLMTLILFIIMNIYIYPLMVTFKYSIKQLYQNSLIFAFAKIFPNLLIVILSGAIILASFIANPLIGYLLFFLITPSFIMFLTNFYVYPKLKTYIIDKIEPESEDLDEKSIFKESKLNINRKRKMNKK